MSETLHSESQANFSCVKVWFCRNSKHDHQGQCLDYTEGWPANDQQTGPEETMGMFARLPLGCCCCNRHGGWSVLSRSIDPMGRVQGFTIWAWLVGESSSRRCSPFRFLPSYELLDSVQLLAMFGGDEEAFSHRVCDVHPRVHALPRGKIKIHPTQLPSSILLTWFPTSFSSFVVAPS